MAGLINMASQVQSAGRNGDTILAHINPEEARMLKAAGGSGTINPETGLREYGFSFKKLIKAAAVGAAIYFTGGAAASALGVAGAAGVSGAITGAAIGGGISSFQGGNILQGALMGGIGGFVAGGGLTDPSSALGKWLGTASPEVATTAGEQGLSTASQAAKGAGISTTASPAEFLADQNFYTSVPAAPSGYTPPPSAFKLNDVVGYDRAAANAIPQSGGGLLDRAAKWAGDNPVPALMVGQSAMAGIGGMATAQAEAEQAELNRQAQLEARTVQGGYGPASFAVTANPYVRRPGLLNASRA